MRRLDNHIPRRPRLYPRPFASGQQGTPGAAIGGGAGKGEGVTSRDTYCAPVSRAQGIAANLRTCSRRTLPAVSRRSRARPPPRLFVVRRALCVMRTSAVIRRSRPRPAHPDYPGYRQNRRVIDQQTPPPDEHGPAPRCHWRPRGHSAKDQSRPDAPRCPPGDLAWALRNGQHLAGRGHARKLNRPLGLAAYPPLSAHPHRLRIKWPPLRHLEGAVLDGDRRWLRP